MKLKVLLLIFVITLVVNEIILLSSRTVLFHDVDRSQKFHAIHVGTVPRIGGLAIFLSISFTFILYYPQLWKLLFPSALVFLTGFIEDVKKNILPKVRLGAIIVASVLATILLNIGIYDIGFIQLPVIISVPLTVIAIAGLANAINIVDGLNGLAAGITATFLLFLGITFHEYGQLDLSFFCFGIVASLFGFLIFNFPYGKIFLGDGGAYFLGFLCAVLAIKLIDSVPGISPWFPFILGIYPVWEVLFSAYRRLRKGRHPFYPDKLHFHTLIFYRVTRSNLKASIVLLIVNFIFSFIAFILKFCTVCLIIEFLVFVILYLFTYKVLINTAKLGRSDFK